MVVGTSTEGPEISESQKTPSTPPKQPPNSPEETPRITNLKEGNKKQKEAAKRLSEYSKESAKRRKGGEARQDADEKPADEPKTSEESLGEVVPDGLRPPQSTVPPQGGSAMLSTGNVIAALGVGVAALCLYLSYKPDSGPQSSQQRQTSSPPKPPPQPPAGFAPQPQTTRFKRL